MSKQLNFDEPLSDDDRQHAINRGLIAEVDANDKRFKFREDTTSVDNPTDTGQAYSVQQATGLTGNEPSGTSDRLTVSGLGAADVNANQPVPGTAEHDALVAEQQEGEDTPTEDSPEGTDYESWSLSQLQAELGKRELSKSGNKAELVSRLKADDEESA